MKQLLEEYVVEAQQLRNQVGLLLRIMGKLLDDEYVISIEELETTDPASVHIEDGFAHVTA
jgi:hypothetical protein